MNLEKYTTALDVALDAYRKRNPLSGAPELSEREMFLCELLYVQGYNRAQEDIIDGMKRSQKYRSAVPDSYSVRDSA